MDFTKFLGFKMQLRRNISVFRLQPAVFSALTRTKYCADMSKYANLSDISNRKQELSKSTTIAGASKIEINNFFKLSINYCCLVSVNDFLLMALLKREA